MGRRKTGMMAKEGECRGDGLNSKRQREMIRRGEGRGKGMRRGGGGGETE